MSSGTQTRTAAMRSRWILESLFIATHLRKMRSEGKSDKLLGGISRIDCRSAQSAVKDKSVFAPEGFDKEIKIAQALLEFVVILVFGIVVLSVDKEADLFDDGAGDVSLGAAAANVMAFLLEVTLLAAERCHLDVVHHRLLQGVHDGCPEEAVGGQAIQSGEFSLHIAYLDHVVGNRSVFGLDALPAVGLVLVILLFKENVELQLENPEQNNTNEKAADPDGTLDRVLSSHFFRRLRLGQKINSYGHTALVRLQNQGCNW